MKIVMPYIIIQSQHMDILTTSYTVCSVYYSRRNYHVTILDGVSVCYTFTRVFTKEGGVAIRIGAFVMRFKVSPGSLMRLFF